MFELTVAIRYLIPKKKSLSTALISLLSIVVISVVVWLVLIFLSVTSGIERNWLEKLTSLHAPLRLTPTDYYYQSYYYLADSLSAASNYTLKTIGEKAESTVSDPYSDQTDAAAPHYWSSPDRHADGRLRDPVKETLTLLNELNAPLQDYEISGALLRLSINHPSTKNTGVGTSISQMSYLLSLMDQNPRLGSLILPPSIDDLNALLMAPANNSEQLKAILTHANIDQIRLHLLDPALINEKTELVAFFNHQSMGEIEIPLEKTTPIPAGWQKGRLTRQGSDWKWIGDSGTTIQQPLLKMLQPLDLHCKIRSMVANISSVQIQVTGKLQDQSINAEIPWGQAIIAHASPQFKFSEMPSIQPVWAFEAAHRCYLFPTRSNQPVILPKTYRDMGIKIGDQGTLNFASHGAASSQEQRIFIEVKGFYDPGLFSMGGRCLIVPKTITRTIHAASQTFSPDGTPTNGIGIWVNLHDEDGAKETIEQKLQAAGLSKYWKVDTFKDYEFSKELFQQFRSDRTLFLLIAVIILLVACCNIISLLVLLVNDKKREIAILQAMGASGRSIATIFGCCGLTMGAFSSLIGTGAAIFTLHHLDSVVQFLSFLQGHAAFQPAFFGQSLPNQLSNEALLFVFIATPLLSLLAGLVPALRATRVRTSIALRQE